MAGGPDDGVDPASRVERTGPLDGAAVAISSRSSLGV
jgi:hypothetical protein